MEKSGPMRQTLTGQDIRDADLPDWRVLLRALHTRYATGDFATGLALVNQIGAAAEEANHHPDLDLRYPHLDITLTSHDAGGLTDRDVAMARRISELAAAAGVPARPETVSELEIALDTADHKRIKPFWRALLGLSGSPDHDDEVIDPSGLVPTLWFQQTDSHEEPRQRFHLDLHLPHDVVAGRIEEALAAGGTLVSDAEAPSFWVLADSDGNKACLCTWQQSG